jgi:hypothetical protein
MTKRRLFFLIFSYASVPINNDKVAMRNETILRRIGKETNTNTGYKKITNLTVFHSVIIYH